MSKTVKIPDNMHPFWCVINGVKYGPWPAGSVQDVPDEVAALIGAIDAASPGEDPQETEEEMAARVAERVVTDTLDNRLVFLAIDLSDYDFDDGAVDVSDAFEAAGIELTQWEKMLDAQNVPLISFTFAYDDTAYVAGVNSISTGNLHCVFPLIGLGSSVPGTAYLTIYNSSAQGFKPFARIDVVGA